MENANGNPQPAPAPTKPKQTTAPKADKPGLLPPTGLDPSKPIDLKMVRAATLILDQSDSGKALVVGRAMANGGHVDGTVSRLLQYPNGTVVVTVTKSRRSGETVAKTDRHITLMGDLEGEVMSEAERVERGFA